MKKFIAIIALAVATIGFASAQNAKTTTQTPEQEAQSLTDKMVKQLTLTDEQTTLVYRQNLERAMQVQKLRTMDVSDEQKNKLIKDNYAVYESNLKGILSADQFKKYLAQKDANKQEAVKTMKN
jgi:hypothetical protein